MKLIQMSNAVSTAVASGVIINLGAVTRKEVLGDCNIFTNTDTSININRPGYYLVIVDANIISGADGNLSIQLYDDSNPVATALATVTSVSNSAYNLNLSKIIRVLPNCCSNVTNTPKVISVHNTGVVGTVSTINISVIKIN